MRRILLTGADGQLGWELRRTLAPLGEVLACTRSDIDLRDERRLRERIREIGPDAIVNAAAYTAVDRAESEEPIAMAVNASAPRILAEEAQRCGASLVHYSTDYVFDGTKVGAYCEDDQPNPINAYGRTKLAGERAVAEVGGRYLIFRTSWVYASRGANFVRTMLRLAKERSELRVVDDQLGAPTWARLIAEATGIAFVQALSASASRSSLSGIYHLTCSGNTTWRAFAETIFANARLAQQPTVVPISSSEYPTPARRPLNSVLSNEKARETFGIALPAWQLALQYCLEETT